MRGAPGDQYLEPVDPLASGLESSARPRGRFENVGPQGAGGEQPDVPARVNASDLLVRVDEHDRGDDRDEPEFVQRTRGEDELDEPALHVEDPGP